MARKNIIKSNEFVYHVRNRTIDGTFYPPNEMASIWNLTCDLLRICTWAFGARVHSFVLMSNHYHLLLSTTEENIDKCIQYFQSELSRRLSMRNEMQALRFATRYKWSVVADPLYFQKVYRYVYQNPLRAGLVNEVEAYPWSTLSGRLGNTLHQIPVYEFEPFKEFLPKCFEEEVPWLNEIISDNQLAAIQKGLKKSIFKMKG